MTVQDGVFALGDLPLQRGGVLPDATIVWRTHGTLSPARDNPWKRFTRATHCHQSSAMTVGSKSR